MTGTLIAITGYHRYTANTTTTTTYTTSARLAALPLLTTTTAIPRGFRCLPASAFESDTYPGGACATTI